MSMLNTLLRYYKVLCSDEIDSALSRIFVSLSLRNRRPKNKMSEFHFRSSFQSNFSVLMFFISWHFSGSDIGIRRYWNLQLLLERVKTNEVHTDKMALFGNQQLFKFYFWSCWSRRISCLRWSWQAWMEVITPKSFLRTLILSPLASIQMAVFGATNPTISQPSLIFSNWDMHWIKSLINLTIFNSIETWIATIFSDFVDKFQIFLDLFTFFIALPTVTNFSGNWKLGKWRRKIFNFWSLFLV